MNLNISKTLPYWQKNTEEQANLSNVFRVTAFALGIITLDSGFLIVSGISGLGYAGAVYGWPIAATGILLTTAGISIRQKRPAEKEQKSAAAIDIQRIWRGYIARLRVEKIKRTCLLSDDTRLNQAKMYIDDPSKRRELPRASSGTTPVFLPKGLPFVLKWSGSPANQKRFCKMLKAHELCKKNNYQHLIIPRARVYADFIIESKLPITMNEIKGQMDYIWKSLKYLHQP